MCRVMEVSASGYYAWRRRPESRQRRENRRLLLKIKALYHESDATYGSPRIARRLRQQGERCSENRVARLMHRAGLRAATPRRWRRTTDSDHRLPVAENVLARSFRAQRPNERWSSDITYIWTEEGWLYLAVILDLYSRRVVGWSMQAGLGRRLVLEALAMALGARQPGAGLLHHSDRGSQYASRAYQRQLEAASITCSMSRRGNCWDNAPVESFFATLKRERVHRRRYRTRAEARRDLFAYIEVWYNRRRLHSALGYRSPADFEAEATREASLAIAA